MSFFNYLDNLFTDVYDYFEDFLNDNTDMEVKVYTVTPKTKAKDRKKVDSLKSTVKPKAYRSTDCAINKADKPHTENIKLSPPWTTLENMLHAFFDKDPEITVGPVKIQKDGIRYIIIESTSCEKIDALSALMKSKYQFGNITLEIRFCVANGVLQLSETNDLYGQAIDALVTNAAVVDIKKVKNFVQDEFVVIEFAKEIVQFFNDDLSDFYGNWNGTYIDVAKELFNENKQIMFTIEK